MIINEKKIGIKILETKSVFLSNLIELFRSLKIPKEATPKITMLNGQTYFVKKASFVKKALSKSNNSNAINRSSNL